MRKTSLPVRVVVSICAPDRRLRAGRRLGFYNDERPYNEERLHQALGYRPPAAILREATQPADMPLRLDKADALPPYPKAQPQSITDLNG